jgi:hypothetical protein
VPTARRSEAISTSSPAVIATRVTALAGGAWVQGKLCVTTSEAHASVCRHGLGGSSRPCGQHQLELGLRHRPGEEIALLELTAPADQELRLFLGLHPLGHHLQAQLAAKGDDGGGQGSVAATSVMKLRSIFNSLIGRRFRWLSDE